MPNRMIKDSLLTSDKIASLSDFEFRVWIGLILSVDDMGRGDARPAIIKGRVFPLRERVSLKDIETAVHGLAAKGCVSLYKVDGKPYFWFPTWGNHQRIRDVKPKYPTPDDADLQTPADDCRNLPQSAASCGELRPETKPNRNQTETKPKGSARETHATPQEPEDYGFGDDLAAAFSDWLKYKREKRQEYKPTGLTALTSQVRNNAAKYGEAAVAALIRQCMAANWQGIVWDKLGKPPETPRGGKPGKYTAQDFQPTPERVQKNNDWLDAFLAEQEGRDGA